MNNLENQKQDSIKINIVNKKDYSTKNLISKKSSLAFETKIN